MNEKKDLAGKKERKRERERGKLGAPPPLQLVESWSTVLRADTRLPWNEKNLSRVSRERNRKQPRCQPSGRKRVDGVWGKRGIAVSKGFQIEMLDNFPVKRCTNDETSTQARETLRSLLHRHVTNVPVCTHARLQYKWLQIQCTLSSITLSALLIRFLFSILNFHSIEFVSRLWHELNDSKRYERRCTYLFLIDRYLNVLINTLVFISNVKHIIS